MTSEFDKSEDVWRALEVSDGKTPVLLATTGIMPVQDGFLPLGPVQIFAARNKYKNGFAIFVHGKTGKYSVDGCQHFQGFSLLAALERVQKYIERWRIE